MNTLVRMQNTFNKNTTPYLLQETSNQG